MSRTNHSSRTVAQQQRQAIGRHHRTNGATCTTDRPVRVRDTDNGRHVDNRRTMNLIQPARLRGQDAPQTGPVRLDRGGIVTHMKSKIQAVVGRHTDATGARRRQRAHSGWRGPVGPNPIVAHGFALRRRSASKFSKSPGKGDCHWQSSPLRG